MKDTLFFLCRIDIYNVLKILFDQKTAHTTCFERCNERKSNHIRDFRVTFFVWMRSGTCRQLEDKHFLRLYFSVVDSLFISVDLTFFLFDIWYDFLSTFIKPTVIQRDQSSTFHRFYSSLYGLSIRSEIVNILTLIPSFV